MAEKEYIDREMALESVREKLLICELLPDTIAKDASVFTLASMNDSLKSIPASDVVSRGAYDKTDWERCVALTQLKEIGKGLGERMDDVRPVVFCRDCKRYGGRPWENNESGICARTDVGVGEFDFCSYGEKKEER